MYKEIYVDLNIIKHIIKDCDIKLKQINKSINNKNKKLKGDNILNITQNDKIYLLIPSHQL